MEYTNLPKTRKEAQTIGAAYYFTGKPCKHGHIVPRKTKGACVECLKLEWHKAMESRQEYFQQYNKSEAGIEAKQRYYRKNKELVIARAQARPADEKHSAQQKWRAKNPLYVLANNKNRRRKHRQATPAWLTRAQKAEMRGLYKSAMTITKTTGVQYVVDHHTPLRSEFVCGLHVPWNLEVITHEANLKKSNKLV